MELLMILEAYAVNILSGHLFCHALSRQITKVTHILVGFPSLMKLSNYSLLKFQVLTIVLT